MNEQLSGRELAEAAATAAAASADRAHGDWSSSAFAFMKWWASSLQGQEFMAEDVRQAARGVLPEPPDSRAWGVIVSRAARARLIKRVGYRPTRDRVSHARPSACWVWLG